MNDASLKKWLVTNNREAFIYNSTDMRELKLLKGNEAIAEAAIRFGVDGFFGYPITPQSEIMETLMADWRQSFGQGDIPFIYVQLANYGKAMAKPVENGSMMQA